MRRRNTPEDFRKFFDGESEKDSVPVMRNTAAAEEDNRETRMVRMLSAYPLLYEIPFAYLVPSQSMLNDNEIRFFYLDRNWVRALLDGMMSPGRGADIDRSHDRRFINKVFSDTVSKSAEVRTKLQGRHKGRRSIRDDELCTGFIMRSMLVRGWRGLEFQGYGSLSSGEVNMSAPLTALRIETLADDVLFGLYKGVIKKLVINEPPEGLYHGFQSLEDRPLVVEVRNLTDGSRTADSVIDVKLRENRVVDIGQLGADIGKSLGVGAESSHVALQLLRTAKKLEITESGGTRI